MVDAGGRRIALLRHRKLRRWLQPGGHADGEANLALTAWREATEETGVEGLRVAVPAIDLDVHRVEPPGEAPHLHLDVRYLVLAPAGARLHRNHESTALAWVDPADLDAYGADEGLRRLAARAWPRPVRRRLTRRPDARPGVAAGQCCASSRCRQTSPGVTQDAIRLTVARLSIGTVIAWRSRWSTRKRARGSVRTRRA